MTGRPVAHTVYIDEHSNNYHAHRISQPQCTFQYFTINFQVEGQTKVKYTISINKSIYSVFFFFYRSGFFSKTFVLKHFSVAFCYTNMYNIMIIIIHAMSNLILLLIVLGCFNQTATMLMYKIIIIDIFILKMFPILRCHFTPSGQ